MISNWLSPGVVRYTAADNIDRAPTNIEAAITVILSGGTMREAQEASTCYPCNIRRELKKRGLKYAPRAGK